jgi:excisionase family DNA binding protein
MSNDLPLLTVPEAGQRLRVSRWTVNRLIQTRQLRTIKIGRRRLVPSEALTDFIAGQSEADR